MHADSDSDSDASLPDLPTLIKNGRKANSTPQKRGNPTFARSSSPLSELHSSQVAPPSTFIRKPSKILRGQQSSPRITRSQIDDEDDTPQRAVSTRKASDNFISLSNTEESSNESDIAKPTPRKRSNRASSPVQVDSDSSEQHTDSSSEEEELPKSSKRTPRSSRAKNRDTGTASESDSPPVARGKRSRVLTEEEKQDLEDDLVDLASSSSDDETKLARKTPVKSERQLALERLKRRRAGLADEDEKPKRVNASGSDSDESSEVEQPLPRSSARDMFAADEDDDNFLADDGDETLGEPDEIPIEFTHFASMKAKELFKFAVEWMVQKKLNPGYRDKAALYDLTFKKLDDEVKGLAGSKFTSSAWRPDFLFALRARPQIAANRIHKLDLEHSLHDRCDACNRSGHPATYEVQFQGRPYHPDTLEDVENEELDDIDDDEEVKHLPARDARGHTILPESHSWFVGRFCMANADTAHTLHHWRYHLYEWVVDDLDVSGHNTPEKVVKRDRWGEPKRRRFADKVLETMVEEGKVRKLYKTFREEVQRARDAKLGQQGGGDDY